MFIFNCVICCSIQRKYVKLREWNKHFKADNYRLITYYNPLSAAADHIVAVIAHLLSNQIINYGSEGRGVEIYVQSTRKSTFLIDFNNRTFEAMRQSQLCEKNSFAFKHYNMPEKSILGFLYIMMNLGHNKKWEEARDTWRALFRTVKGSCKYPSLLYY